MGNENMIYISVEEYKKLIEAAVRIEVFTDFVKEEGYITKEECGRYLGFELQNKED